MKRKAIFLTITLISGVIIGLLVAIKLDLTSFVQGQNIKQESPLPREGSAMENAIINVANTVGKAVVSISTEHTTKLQGKRLYFDYPGDRPFREDELYRFFDDFLGEIPEREYKQMGLGSGVIIDADGYILTNEHVVNDADKITVTLSDGREFKGEIKGKDPRSDLAIIKISAKNLPVVPLGDSDKTKIGEWVVAVGNPFAFALDNTEPTVTVGVISALHRSLGRGMPKDRDYSDLIQTDAAINPGNSGGPLVNLTGEIVGINVAIFSTSGGYQGIGFAIPINTAKRIISQLIEGKKILYGWLGIKVQDLNEDLAKYFGLPDKNGILIAKVIENSPAAKTGMKESDIIKQYDGNNINNVKDLLNYVGKTKVGYKVKVLLIRDKKNLTLEVQVGERPEEIEKIVKSITSSNWRGLEVEDINAANARRFRVGEKNGVVITKVEKNTPAEEAGLMVGDVIVEINKQSVRNIGDYELIMKGLGGNALVRTQRGYFLVKQPNQ